MPVYWDSKRKRWWFEFDRLVDGKRFRKRKLLPRGWTRAQAEAFERKEGAALSAIAQGIAKPRRTIDEAVACYLRERAPELKHGSNVAHELDTFRDWWSGRAIEELPSACSEYAKDQFGALSPATIKNRISYLRAACRFAWKHHGMVDHDPGARVAVPVVRNSREVVVSRAEMLGLAFLCRDRAVRATIRCLWYSGLRLGELRAAKRVDGAFVLTDTKNATPRVVPIVPRIRSAALVPVPPHGTLHYWWRLARRLMGMEHVTLHDLRHSAASELIATGASLGDVGAILGHKSPASTRRYAHWKIDRMAEVMGRMGRKVG